MGSWMQSSSGANGVTHLLVEEPGWVAQLLAERFPTIDALIALGSVYRNKKRLSQNAWVEHGEYLRIHPQPLRFETQKLDWLSRVIFSGPIFHIINKPAGVPVHAQVDNAVENVVCALTPLLGPLYVTHRLDTGTSGLVLLAKQPRFQALFNRRLATRKVFKHYRALSSTQPESGEWLHYMEENNRVPKTLSASPVPDFKECRTLARSGRKTPRGFETLLQPFTGRTHQLRAQMALKGAPILGDTRYGAEDDAVFHPLNLALHCDGLGFEFAGNQWSFSCPPPW